MLGDGISDISPKNSSGTPGLLLLPLLGLEAHLCLDVKIVSAVDLKCGPVGIFTSPCGHGSDHVVLRLTGVAMNQIYESKGVKS